MGEILTFGDVINRLRNNTNLRAYRSGWNGKSQYIMLQSPTPLSKMTRPYLYITTTDMHLIPWLASQADMLEDDWVIEAVLNDNVGFGISGPTI